MAALPILAIFLNFSIGETSATSKNKRQDIINKASLSVYRFEFKANNQIGNCSGTAISKKALLTAKHCLTNSDIRINDKILKPYKLYADDGDTGIIVFEDDIFINYSEISKTPASIGESVFMLGSPGPLSKILRSGEYSGYIIDKGKRYNFYNFPIFFGDSGAGIFNEKGEIVACVSSIYTLSDGEVNWHQTIACDINFNDDILYKAGVKIK